MVQSFAWIVREGFTAARKAPIHALESRARVN
jgi:hypothetical protein